LPRLAPGCDLRVASCQPLLRRRSDCSDCLNFDQEFLVQEFVYEQERIRGIGAIVMRVIPCFLSKTMAGHSLFRPQKRNIALTLF
jgi:hypothetical protein